MLNYQRVETILESGIRMRYLSKYPHVIGGTSRFQNRGKSQAISRSPHFFCCPYSVKNQILKKQYWYSPLKYYPPVN